MENRATSARVARNDATASLARSLGDWASGPGPLHRKLARALASVVERGELGPGDRLPSERPLAATVAVSRGVAVAAYDHLVAEGLVERRPGSGTFVSGSVAQPLPAGREGSALVGRLVDQPVALAASGGAAPIDLSISVLHESTGLPQVTVALDGLAAVAADSPWGLPALRSLVARRLTTLGLPSTAGEVVVTTGAQQGISTAIGCWVRPGDLVVVDDPTYPGVLAALAAAGAVVRAVPVDRHGPVLAELVDALDDRPSLLYLQSGVHSPTGGRLSDHRRRVIAREVVARRTPVVEDLAMHALDWSGRAPSPPLAALAPDHPIAVVGSYSKRFWAGLRVGFVRAPEPVARRLVRVKATHDLGSSAVAQAAALALLEHPHHDRAVRRRNAELARRAQLLAGLLDQRLPSWRCTAPDGGLSLWVRLPRPVAAAFARVAATEGVIVATAEGLSAEPAAHPDHLRLTFALPAADLRAAVDRLAVAWASLP